MKSFSQYAVEWKRWHYDTPTWVRVKKLFRTPVEARIEQKTLANLTTRIVPVRD